MGFAGGGARAPRGSKELNQEDSMLKCRPLHLIALALCALSFAELCLGEEPNVKISARAGSQNWTVRDGIEVSRVTSVAVDGGGRHSAFVVMTPDIDTNRNRYELFAMSSDGKAPARRMLEAGYIAEVSNRPKTEDWTVLADQGAGVQLYQVTPDGHLLALLVNPNTVIVGGSDGLQASATIEPRLTGIRSYAWSRDGRLLWYSKIRLRSVLEQAAIVNAGMVYDDSHMTGGGPHDISRAALLAGTELHVLEPDTGFDRLIALMPPDITDGEAFRSDNGSVFWVSDHEIQYYFRGVSQGVQQFQLYRYLVDSGQNKRVGAAMDAQSTYHALPMESGFRTVRRVGGVDHLVTLDLDGRTTGDEGRVGFDSVGGGQNVWLDTTRRRMIVAVRYPERDGLVGFPFGAFRSIDRSADELSPCDFNEDLSYGICSRESLGHAPEVVAIDPSTGRQTVVARPNARYDEKQPLDIQARNWTNRFGQDNTGYVVYPRNYARGTFYPGIVITHGRNARNTFMDDRLQWEYPVAALVERGYFVLLVNEPRNNSNRAGIVDEHSPASEIEKFQFSEGFGPLASLEAAAQSLVDEQKMDPKRIGIAGYSRGSTIARFALSHSRVFSAGSSADANWWDAGGFWQGAKHVRTIYTNLFGGSPFDAQAYPQYLSFSPSARPHDFAGPLLQQFTSAMVGTAIELDQQLKDAGIPTELIFFPDEAHIFWQPKHRASAAEQNLDWFDYWLLGRKNSDESKRNQYRRWDEMAVTWHRDERPRR
jgi:dipeptidyl aminopeptidase/acylaminoacyl peptidase